MTGSSGDNREIANFLNETSEAKEEEEEAAAEIDEDETMSDRMSLRTGSSGDNRDVANFLAPGGGGEKEEEGKNTEEEEQSGLGLRASDFDLQAEADRQSLMTGSSGDNRAVASFITSTEMTQRQQILLRLTQQQQQSSDPSMPDEDQIMQEMGQGQQQQQLDDHDDKKHTELSSQRPTGGDWALEDTTDETGSSSGSSSSSSRSRHRSMSRPRQAVPVFQQPSQPSPRQQQQQRSESKSDGIPLSPAAPRSLLLSARQPAAAVNSVNRQQQRRQSPQRDRRGEEKKREQKGPGGGGAGPGPEQKQQDRVIIGAPPPAPPNDPGNGSEFENGFRQENKITQQWTFFLMQLATKCQAKPRQLQQQQGGGAFLEAEPSIRDVLRQDAVIHVESEQQLNEVWVTRLTQEYVTYCAQAMKDIQNCTYSHQTSSVTFARLVSRCSIDFSLYVSLLRRDRAAINGTIWVKRDTEKAIEATKFNCVVNILRSLHIQVKMAA